MRYAKKINLPFLLILAGSLSWSLTMVKSGLCWDAKCASGVGFWGANGHDAIWHLALINHFAKGDFQMPVFAGVQLKNYHIGFDWVLAQIHNITQIPGHILYFQIIPPVLAILIGWLTYKFVFLWKNSKQQAIWALFFVYFGSGWGWLVSLVRDRHIAGESMFWAQQSISTLINPPFAVSLVFLLLGAIFILKYEKTGNKMWLVGVVLSLGLVIEVKVYAGLLGLAGLGIVGLYKLLKKDFVYILIFFVTSLLSFGIFKLAVPSSGSLIVFQPFWFLETMMALSDRLGWQKFYDAMTAYRFGGNYFKEIPAYLIAFLIFWFGNLGTRGVKEILVLRWIKDIRNVGIIEVFLSSIIIAGIIVPMFFLQKGTPWNTIQFLYYSLFFSSVLAGITVGDWMKSKALGQAFAIGALLVLFTIPTSITTLWYHYLPSRPPAKISNEELQALDFLGKQANGVVLTYPYDQKAAEKAQENPPRPLYLYDSTAYVAAFSAQQVYLEDQVNLDITDYPWRERREKVLTWLDTLDRQYAYQFLRDNNIKYVYWLKGQRAKLGETQLGIRQIFENNQVDIYQVN